MKMYVTKSQLNSRRAHPVADSIETEGRDRQHSIGPNTWVHLLELPNEFSFDEALLLCRLSDSNWSAWIPDYGETVLHASQFCQIF